MKPEYPVIDLHTHLRDDISGHTKLAKESGIALLVYMANSQPPLDNLKTIKESLSKKRYCKALPVSAITKNLAGKELVEVEEIKHYVVGFSDDGKYLENLNLLKNVLEKDVLVLAHCSPPFEIGIKNPHLETKFIERYVRVFKKLKKGKLHIQHISQKESVNLIRKAKKEGVKITCETCPHYFTWTKDDLETKVNPPLAEREDLIAIRQGLADGTIDVIASDYAPLPRKAGIAGFRAFIPLCYGLVLSRVLTAHQLKEKIYLNPKKILASGENKITASRTP
ncbi:MAG: hypothetical protein COT33_01230 [Candidatus Nealsonbacteria bacterium CG08_land_8_20_14_0_20_38_20]|uniref:Amidohydrolase-related domain-containing protein n=1 Tax=Candidatus Nealsonbacteria bacterium CG08_land_8_20_14_0_20_38_20 TaxID=1974705 RepID=A0A2H0YM50_9BACT|nr:MAG: hypothetical protein COT33_01230 [Candidatus Nealsonbacteria bacterium CG08_land_8_20_14_0_20_38_20]